MHAAKRTQPDVATKPSKHKTNLWPTFLFETENFPFEKKNRSWSESNPGPWPSQTKYLLPLGLRVKKVKKLEIIMKE